MARGRTQCGIVVRTRQAYAAQLSPDFRFLMQNHVQQGTVDLNIAVVIN